MRVSLLIFVLVLSATGCVRHVAPGLEVLATTGSGVAFTPDGFAPLGMGFRIPFADASRCTFIGSSWRIASVPVDAATRCPTSGGAQSTSHLALVREGAGTGIIWARALPLPSQPERTSLRALADGYATSISQGGHFGGAVLGSTSPYASPRFATIIRDRLSTTLAGRRAAVVLVDMTGLERGAATPSARASRGLMVFVQLSATYTRYDGFAERSEPIILVAGYVDQNSTFESGLPDFLQFLRTIRFDGVGGT